MGQSLNMTLLAEGLETSAQRDALIHSGCTRFQGNLFSKPKPIDE
jgi:EAL domain-containing protein (putative c-di-GMP-specific phosphodiesterase class I)